MSLSNGRVAAHFAAEQASRRLDETLGWTKQEYAAALQGLIRDANPRFDAPGQWLTFLRARVKADIERLEKEILALRGLHLPGQQEQFNLLTGEIKGLKRFLKDDFGIAEALAAAIEEAT